MLHLTFAAEDIQALRTQRFAHPHPLVQLKMETLYLHSQGLPQEAILRLCAISKATYYRSLHEYREGGVQGLKAVSCDRPKSELHAHRATLEAYFVAHPPATVGEACAQIQALTGLQRHPTQVRAFLPRQGRCRGPGEFPKKRLEPRLTQAQEGQRAVYFVDAAHFVYGAFLGVLWCLQRLFVKTPSGRQRLNVLGALNAVTQEIVSVANDTYVTAETVCTLLVRLAALHVGMPITVVLDNARYQRCALVQALAAHWNIELLFLPAYSPNLNLIERFWKFVKKRCLYGKYYADHRAFEQAILDCIAQASTRHRAELQTLLTLHFQTFEDIPVVQNQDQGTLFPGPSTGHSVKQKVSSMAA